MFDAKRSACQSIATSINSLRTAFLCRQPPTGNRPRHFLLNFTIIAISPNRWHRQAREIEVLRQNGCEATAEPAVPGTPAALLSDRARARRPRSAAYAQGGEGFRQRSNY